MKANVTYAVEIDGRIRITTDSTFKVCDKEGVESDGNSFSVGQRSLLQAFMKTNFGAILMAKTAGNPQAYSNVSNLLVYLLCNAELTFERKKLNVGDKRSDGTPVEKVCYQTTITNIVTRADMAVFMQLLPMIEKRQQTLIATNPFV